MIEYTSCFVGVPLPKKFQKDYEKLLEDIGKLYPNWEIAYPKTPHITVYYLDKQSQHLLATIEHIVQPKISILKKKILKVNGFGYFSGEGPRVGVVFLDIVYPAAFAEFNVALKDKLSNYYSADNNLPFHPHITIARVKSLTSQSTLKRDIAHIESKISKINWEFPITKVILYGVDSTKKPQHQVKLITIPAK